MVVLLRIVIALLLPLHALAALGMARADSGGLSQGARSQTLSVRIDPCGPVCCCGPNTCPCVLDVPIDGSGTPEPATPPQRSEIQGVRTAPTASPAELVRDDEPRTASPAFVLSARPASDFGRRVMQLQCVWRT